MNTDDKKKYRKDQTASQLREKLKKSDISRDEWKEKHKKKYEETKILKMRLKEARESRERWKKDNLVNISENTLLKEKLQCLEEENIQLKLKNITLEEEVKKKIKKTNKLIDGEKTKRSLFTIYFKWLIVHIIICTSAPFRTIEKIFKAQMLCGLFNAKKIPSDTTCRRWFNLVGFYKLMKSKEYAEDWIYIIDNSIRSECRKVCLILGIRASLLKEGKALTFENLEPIELRVIQSNNEVEGIIINAIEKTGVPIQICSDLGSDIMPSIKKVINAHPIIKHIPDIMHHVGNMLKKKLNEDKRWKKFVTNTNKSNNKLKQSSLGFMCPPNFRGKSRFLNCSNVVDWASTCLLIFQNMKQSDVNWDEMKEKLGWLTKSKDNIVLFQELFDLADIGKEVIRKLHIQKNSVEIAENLLRKAAKHQEGIEFAENIISFIKEQCQKVEENQIMAGSSEIIESAFGKLKIFDREVGKSGFTGSIIGLAACFGKSDFESIKNAFKTYTYNDVKNWIEKNLGTTFMKKRKQLFFKFSKKEKLNLNTERVLEVKRDVA